MPEGEDMSLTQASKKMHNRIERHDFGRGNGSSLGNTDEIPQGVRVGRCW